MKREQILLILVSGFLLLFTDFSWLLILAVLLCIVLISHFISAFGKSLPILGILSITGAIQLFLTPILIDEFDLYFLEGKSGIPVSYDQYFGYVLPSFLALLLGFVVVKQTYPIKEIIKNAEVKIAQNSHLTYYFLALGTLGTLGKEYLPTSLAFVGHIQSQLIYIGALYALYSKSSNRFLVSGLVLSYTFILSIASSLFWDVIMWSLFFSMVYAIKRPPKLLFKLSLLAVGMVLLVILQSVKESYRTTIFMDEYTEEEKLSLFWDLGREEWDNFTSGANSLDESSALILRLNQAYWDGLVYKRVPSEVDYANGETILLGTLSGLIPRFLWPDKPSSGTDIFEKYTGHEGHGGSYFSLSPIAESYLNFGLVGGTIFLFFFGCFLKFFFCRIIKISYFKYPTLILWVPLIFYQVIRIETDYNVIFNHLIKSSVMVFLIFKSTIFLFGKKL